MYFPSDFEKNIPGKYYTFLSKTHFFQISQKHAKKWLTHHIFVANIPAPDVFVARVVRLSSTNVQKVRQNTCIFIFIEKIVKIGHFSSFSSFLRYFQKITKNDHFSKNEGFRKMVIFRQKWSFLTKNGVFSIFDGFLKYPKNLIFLKKWCFLIKIGFFIKKSIFIKICQFFGIPSFFIKNNIP